MTTTINKEFLINAKPFLKWAGGKTQLLEELYKRIPAKYKEKKIIDVYIEPFVGGGAFFFYLKRNYIIKKSYLFDINKELILAYKVIQKYHNELIRYLKEIEKSYYTLKTEEKKKNFTII